MLMARRRRGDLFTMDHREGDSCRSGCVTACWTRFATDVRAGQACICSEQIGEDGDRDGRLHGILRCLVRNGTMRWARQWRSDSATVIALVVSATGSALGEADLLPAPWSSRRAWRVPLAWFVAAILVEVAV